MNDTASFEDLLVQCLPSLRAFAISLSGRADRADDLVQDTACKALRARSSFEMGANIKAWLFTILRNEFYSGARKASRKLEVSDPDGIAAANFAVGEGQTWSYDLKVIRKRMRLLNRVQRIVVELCAIEGHANEYAADVLGIPIGTVKSALNRARTFLETGDEQALLPEVQPTEPLPIGADMVEALYREGKSVSEIKASLPDISRGDVMRIIAERKLRR